MYIHIDATIVLDEATDRCIPFPLVLIDGICCSYRDKENHTENTICIIWLNYIN